jgi:hypothetical protein
MKALVFHKPKDVRVETVEDPMSTPPFSNRSLKEFSIINKI